MIANLQVLRAFAALAVTFYHTGLAVNGVHTTLAGVEIFFCISGFIMVYVSRDENAKGSFFLARLVRIVPLYWVATLAFFVWAYCGLSNAPYSWPILWDRLVHRPSGIIGWFVYNNSIDRQSLVALGKSLLFIPYLDRSGNMHPILGVGWTLNLEMFFYATFALALKWSRAWAPAIVCAVLLLVKVAAARIEHPLLEFYAGNYTTYFIFGIACFYVWRATPVEVCREHKSALLAATALIAGVFVFLCFWPRPEQHIVLGRTVVAAWEMGFPAALLMLALWGHSAGAEMRSDRWLLLGAASYALYLFHPFVMETARPMGEQWSSWMDTTQSIPAAVLAVAISVALGIAVHKWLEMPMQRRVRKALQRQEDGRVVLAGS